MFSKALIALAASGSFLQVLVDAVASPPIKFCKKSPCPGASCPVSVTTDAAAPPSCKIYNTKTVLGGHGFKGTSGGAWSVFADIQQPPSGCQVIVRSPAAVDRPGCGVEIGDFHNPACVALALHDTFMLQRKCDAAKMIRGMDWKRGLDGFSFLDENGTVIEPIEVGEPPELRSRDLFSLEARKASPADDSYLLDSLDAPVIEEREADPAPAVGGYFLQPPDDSMLEERDALPETDAEIEDHLNNLIARQNAASCKAPWKPDSPADKVFTKSAAHTQIVATNVDGGHNGATVTISKARTASWSISMTAGVNLEVVEASTTITFEKQITDTKSFTFNIPAGQNGNVGFTPNLKCSKGKCSGSGSHGTVCTGYRQGGAIAGTYAVIAQS